MKALIKKPTTWLAIQILALIGGNYVGWSTIFGEVQSFCDQEGKGLSSLLIIEGTYSSNPLLSPCFWGSIAFLFALIWSLSIAFSKNPKKTKSSARHLSWLLIGGTVFAFANNLPIFYRFFTSPIGEAVSCSGNLDRNPLLTRCFLGFSAFLIATISALLYRRTVRK